MNYAFCPQLRTTLWVRKRRELSVLKLVRHFQAFADRWMQAIFRSEIELYHFFIIKCFSPLQDVYDPGISHEPREVENDG